MSKATNPFNLELWQQKIFDSLVKGDKMILMNCRRGKTAIQNAARKEIERRSETRGQRANFIVIDEVADLDLDKIKPKISLDAPRQV